MGMGGRYSTRGRDRVDRWVVESRVETEARRGGRIGVELREEQHLARRAQGALLVRAPVTHVVPDMARF